MRHMSLSRTHCLAVVVAALLVFTICAPSASARASEELPFATSADDPILQSRIAALSPSVRPEEAQQVARCAYNTGRELKREWRVVWPPGLQNFLVNTGARKGGLCFQWATELLIRLDALKLETLEFHWAESFERTASEHNVIVVTARGQPFAQGILLDNWRYGGRLIWGPINSDPHYQWKENKAEAIRRLGHRPR
jgi:hypothetical protein